MEQNSNEVIVTRPVQKLCVLILVLHPQTNKLAVSSSPLMFVMMTTLATVLNNKMTSHSQLSKHVITERMLDGGEGVAII